MSVSIGFKTDTGNRREHNEDSYAVLRRAELDGKFDALLLVSDGMGGVGGGEVASRLVAQKLPEAAALVIERVPNAAEDPAQVLQNGVQSANRQVWSQNQAEARPQARRMGATCVAALLKADQLTVANVGDSRAYLLRKGKLSQITEDHSQVWVQVQAGQMTREQARNSKHRNVVTRVIGIEQDVKPDIFSLVLEQGDTLLLCSDGLSTEATDHEIARILAATPTAQETAERLVEAALDAGGSDNITVLVLRYGAFTPLTLTSPPSPQWEDDEEEETTDETAEWRKQNRTIPQETPAERPALFAYPEPTVAKPSRAWMVLAILLLLAALAEGVALGLLWREHTKLKSAISVKKEETPPPPKERTATPLLYGNPKVFVNKPVRDAFLNLDSTENLLAFTLEGKTMQISPNRALQTLPFPPVTAVGRPAPASLAIVAQDRSGNRYQAHPASKSIYKFDPTGTRVHDSIGKGKAVALTALIVNGHGDLFYISQQRLFRIAAYETGAERKAGETSP